MRCTDLFLVSLFMCMYVANGDESTDRAIMHERHRALLKTNCVSCHGPEKQKGKFRVDDLPFTITTVEAAEKWQKVLNAMNSGEMPPEDEKQPTNVAKTDLLDDLSNAMVAARRTLSDQNGVITMRRLNRREYKNTLRELLGVEINVAELPSDTGTGGFDTAGQNLFMSANQLEQYQSLGLQALEEAFTRSAVADEERKTANKKPKTPELVKFGIGDNRQVGSVTAKGVSKVRFECETANEKVSRFVEQQNDDRARANAWVKAVNDAAAKPENLAVATELRKTAKNENEFRREWMKISKEPSQSSFGNFKNDATGGFVDLANRALSANWQKYHEYYLSRPHLDQGAYLATPTLHPQWMALGFLQLPVPGEWTSGNYVFRVRLAATKEARPEQKFLEIGMHPRNGMVRATFEITGTMDKPQIVEMPFTLTKAITDSGDRTLFIREKGAWDNNDEGGRKRQEALKRNGIGPEAVLWIDYMEIERVSDPAGSAPGLAALGIPLDNTSAVTEIKPALQRFCAAAFRGMEPPASFVAKLGALYDTQRKGGAKHSVALKETLSVVLASPMFLYLAEPAADGKRRALNGIELANRLSYFLWSAPPDDTLLALGKSGALLKADVLMQQTTRLLDDERAQDFVHGFVHQWLGMDRIDFFQVNRSMYPRFDDSTKLNAKKEVFATFAHLLQHNAPLSDLLKADYVIVNHLLADFYGIEGVKGDAFQKVSLPPNSPRGGLLGMATIHFMGGNGEHTSPVERGVWVLRKLLNNPPPPAPANVPQIARLAGKVLTTRERLQMHQQDAQCASCHRKIDPIGFGLENFDAVGQWRTEDTYQVKDDKGKPVKGASKTWKIETNSAFYKGPAFKDYFELRNLIAARSDDFARGFSTALIEYGIGRSTGFRDDPLITEMLVAAKKEKLGLRGFIQALVASKEFHTK